MKNTYLNEILKVTKTSVEEKKKRFPLIETSVPSELLLYKRSFLESLRASIESHRVAVIAEMKKASPSQGLIRENYNPSELAKQYLEAKAACLSILTDEPFFKGSLEHISIVKETVDLPVLRKDFIVDEYQIHESQLKGADCILLIVAALSKNQLQEFSHLASELNLEVLVEVHDEEEVERALEINSNLIGINNRNLETFEVNLETTERLIEKIPEEILTVSESGIKSSEDVKKIMSSGVSAFLVGEVFMRAEDPGKELKNLFFI